MMYKSKERVYMYTLYKTKETETKKAKKKWFLKTTLIS